jgi:hypothetical protein
LHSGCAHGDTSAPPPEEQQHGDEAKEMQVTQNYMIVVHVAVVLIELAF